MKKIVITGGHLTPAIAIIQKLQEERDWEIYYFGRKYATEGEKIMSVESKVIPPLGIEFVTISAGRLQRHFTRHTLPSLLRVPLGFIQSFYHLFRIRPQIICSFGGYVSVPAVIAGWLLRIPILTHEQTVIFGLSSKINAFFADKICVSFGDSLKYFPAQKVVLTGNPIRKEVFFVKKTPKFSVGKLANYPTIYITGGNQGARIINHTVFKILPKLLAKYYVIHQCGEADYKSLKEKTKLIDTKLLKKYFLVPYVGLEDIGWVLAHADLVISRSGANTVCEMAALGKPVLFIPIPWTFLDEQNKNAQMLVTAQTAEILPQGQLSPESLWQKISLMMNHLKEYEKNGFRAKKLVRLDAAERMLQEINELAKSKKTP